MIITKIFMDDNDAEVTTLNFSRLERITIGFTLLLLAFLAGWSLCRQVEHARAFVPVPVTSAPSSSALPFPSGSSPTVERININTADAALLQTLPEIGEKRAADIIAYREANGPFAIPEAISDVPGIGASTLAAIIDLITVGD